jgi:DNA polymerase-1
MAGIRNRLTELSGGAPLAESPHLVFFLHDEVVVHTPSEHAEAVASAIRDAAAEAGRLLFGATPVSFPLQIAVVEDYGSAK